MRVRGAGVLSLVAAGASETEILEDYPSTWSRTTSRRVLSTRRPRLATWSSSLVSACAS
ncbi:MAG: hypothetical protein ACRDL5_13975 [Solirubrobacteraceae bacterium]